MRYAILSDVHANAAALRAVLTDAADMLAAVTAALPADTSRDVYRLILTGQTDAPPDAAALTRELEGRFFGLELRDETSLRRDVWAEQGDDSLRGLFLSYLWEKWEATPGEAGRERVLRAARYGLAAMENGEEPTL